MRGPLEMVVHIGMGKTGTSSTQFFLHENRERLREVGVLYPRSPGNARHVRLGLFLLPDEELELSPAWTRQDESDPATFRKVFRRRLVAEINESGLPRVLFSEETLFKGSNRTMRRLGRFASRLGDRLRLVAYLRRQDDHMVSVYQQGVKTGWTVRLSEWAQSDMSGLYDYSARLRRWQRWAEPDELVVRRFESSAFAGGSLFQDFLDATGVAAAVDGWDEVPNHNVSLDVESVEFLRLLNIYRVENEAGGSALAPNGRLAKRLGEVSRGPVLTLPAGELDRFMARWRESNRAVAQRFLGDPSGELFRMARKTANTTTDQRLDPARVEPLLQLLELPESLLAPLIRLAERA